MEQWSDPDLGSGISKQNFLIAFIQKQVDPGSGAFLPPDPGSGSGMEQWSDPELGSGIKHPGTATLVVVYDFICVLTLWIPENTALLGISTLI
jgi:hypothetical protein